MELKFEPNDFSADGKGSGLILISWSQAAEYAQRKVRLHSEMQKNMTEWLSRVVKGSGEKIEQSDIFATIFTKSYKESPQCALELGMALLLDKPLALIVIEGTPIPEGIKRAAIAIEYVKDSEDMERATMAVLTKVNEVLDAKNDKAHH